MLIMNKSRILYWVIFVVAVLLAVLAIKFFFQIAKALLILILFVILTPLIYLMLRNLLTRHNDRGHHPLKKRD